MSMTLPTAAAPGQTLHRVAVLAAGATIATQILWVLVPDTARDATTVLSVALFATASLAHAAATRGAAWTLRYALIAAGIGWLAEAVGTTTGWPFGAYQYTDSLGPKIGPVPLVIPLAWLMMAYPVLLAVRRTVRSRVLQIGYAAALLTAWDLFLDPQMVAEGHWVWDDPVPALPGIPGIPAQNFAGWFLVGVVLYSAATALLPAQVDLDDRLPAAMLLWVFASNVMANAVFWGRPAVALIGGTVMGLLLVPWLRSGVAQRAYWVRG